MKTTFKAIAVLFIAFAIASCGSKGLSDETKAAMAKFETDWAAMMTSATDFTANLQTAIDSMAAHHAGMTEMTAGLKQADLDKLKADMDVCMKTETDAKAMLEAANGAITEWTTAGTDWAAWKKKRMPET